MGSGKLLKIEKIGDFVGEVKQKDGTTSLITLSNVHYVPHLYCNLFSITTTLDKGFRISGGGSDPMTLTKERATIKFDTDIKSGGGRLLGVVIKPSNRTPSNKKTTMTCNDAHKILAHSGEATTRATADKLGWKLTKKMNFCNDCAEAKAKVKDIPKETTTPPKYRGDIISLDISSSKRKSKGNKKF